MKIALLASSLFFSWFTSSVPSDYLRSQDTTLFCRQQLDKAELAVKNPKEKEKIIFIKELDKYLRDFGLVKGNAYFSYSSNPPEKAELTVIKRIVSGGETTSKFSSEVYYGTEKEMREKEKECAEKNAKNPSEKYETSLRTSIQSPNSPITFKFLQYSYGTIADLFIHERMHDEYNLPMEIEEALCDAAADHLAKDFFQTRIYRADLAGEVELQAQKQMQEAEKIIEAYDTLEWLYGRKGVTEEKKEEFRNKYLVEMREEFKNPAINDAWIHRQMYYHRYFRELYLIPLRMELTVEEMLWWYASLPASLSTAEKEILNLCEELHCKEKK